MGGLWLALFLLQVYFAIITRVYGVEQREDHKRYERWEANLYGRITMLKYAPQHFR